MKKIFAVEIEVDENNIARKYPNYSINWDSPEEFIKSTTNNIEDLASIDAPEDALEKWGYQVKVLGEISEKEAIARGL